MMGVQAFKRGDGVVVIAVCRWVVFVDRIEESDIDWRNGSIVKCTQGLQCGSYIAVNDISGESFI